MCCLSLGQPSYWSALYPHTLSRLVTKGLDRLSAASRNKHIVNQMPVCIDGTPLVTPLSSNTNAGFVGIQTRIAVERCRSVRLDQFEAQSFGTTKDCRPIHVASPLGKEVYDVFVGKRISHIYSHPHKMINVEKRSRLIGCEPCLPYKSVKSARRYNPARSERFQ